MDFDMLCNMLPANGTWWVAGLPSDTFAGVLYVEEGTFTLDVETSTVDLPLGTRFLIHGSLAGVPLTLTDAVLVSRLTKYTQLPSTQSKHTLQSKGLVYQLHTDGEATFLVNELHLVSNRMQNWFSELELTATLESYLANPNRNPSRRSPINTTFKNAEVSVNLSGNGASIFQTGAAPSGGLLLTFQNFISLEEAYVDYVDPLTAFFNFLCGTPNYNIGVGIKAETNSFFNIMARGWFIRAENPLNSARLSKTTPKYFSNYVKDSVKKLPEWLHIWETNYQEAAPIYERIFLLRGVARLGERTLATTGAFETFYDSSFYEKLPPSVPKDVLKSFIKEAVSTFPGELQNRASNSLSQLYSLPSKAKGKELLLFEHKLSELLLEDIDKWLEVIWSARNAAAHGNNVSLSSDAYLLDEYLLVAELVLSTLLLNALNIGQLSVLNSDSFRQALQNHEDRAAGISPTQSTYYLP